jgi:fused signal recognition particle receptor
MSALKIFSPSQIKDQLEKTSIKISSGIGQIFSHKKLDDKMLEELEDLMVESDIGLQSASKFIKDLKAQKFNKKISEIEIKNLLSARLTEILLPYQKTLTFDNNSKPQIIIFNGVNGVGKTTSVGKISYLLANKNKKVIIASCDTFRAAAEEQLKIWAQRSGCQVIAAKKEGEDPASVAHRALIEAKQQNADILLIDTAGRLQNKQNLMNELKKINQVLKKIDPLVQCENILVLDSTTGQNSKNQLEIFDKIVGITGLIITKLDGSAKGGILVALSEQFKKPIYAICIGEKITDLQEFDAEAFSKNLLGIK